MTFCAMREAPLLVFHFHRFRHRIIHHCYHRHRHCYCHRHRHCHRDCHRQPTRQRKRAKRELYAGGQSLKPGLRPSYERTAAEDWPPAMKQPPLFSGSIAEVYRRTRAWGGSTADSMRIHLVYDHIPPEYEAPGILLCVCERECVCVCERECDCVCERECECVCERECECVCERV